MVALGAGRWAGAHVLALCPGGVVHEVSRLAHMLTQFILPFLFVVLLASYYTSIGCRLAHRWRRRLGWYIALVGAVLAGVSSVCFMLVGFWLQPGQTPYPGIFWRWILTVSIGGSVLGLALDMAVVWYCRRNFRAQAR